MHLNTHFRGIWGLNEAKKPEVGIGIFEKNRHFTPFLRIFKESILIRVNIIQVPIRKYKYKYSVQFYEDNVCLSFLHIF